MPGEWTVVPTLGGGLEFSKQPIALDPTQWAYGENMVPFMHGSQASWDYTQVLPPAPWTPAQQRVIGVLANPFDVTYSLIVVTKEKTSSRCRFWVVWPRLDGPGYVDIKEIAHDGVGAPVTLSDYDFPATSERPAQCPSSAVQSAFLNGWLVITVGLGLSPTGFSMMQWGGGLSTPTYSTITGEGAATFRVAHLESFAGHLIAAVPGHSPADQRKVLWSDAESTIIWKPAFDNSADFGILDDSVSGITGMALLQPNALGIFTRAGAYALSPTGNIPPFTRTYVGMRPALDICVGHYVDMTSTGLARGPLSGAVPQGVVIVSTDNVYLGAEPIGMPIYRYLREDATLGGYVCPRVLWHPRWNCLLLGRIQEAGNPHFLVYAPDLQAWGQFRHPGGGTIAAIDQAVILHSGNEIIIGVPPTDYDVEQSPRHRHVVAMSNSTVWMERELPPAAGSLATRPCFLDTRDWHQAPSGTYTDAVKIDWEAMIPEERLSLYACSREQLDPQALAGGPRPSRGFQYDLSGLFELVGELKPGESELPTNLRGKFTRFRFALKYGYGRIRGYAFRSQVASDRLTSPNPTGVAGTPALERPSGWDESDFDKGKWS